MEKGSVLAVTLLQSLWDVAYVLMNGPLQSVELHLLFP